MINSFVTTTIIALKTIELFFFFDHLEFFNIHCYIVFVEQFSIVNSMSQLTELVSFHKSVWEHFILSSNVSDLLA